MERLVLVGNPGEVHVGAHLYQAAGQLGYTVQLCNSEGAFESFDWWRKLNWHLRGHRPSRLMEFGDLLFRNCTDFGATCLLSTGIAPIEETTLQRLGELGVRRINFLTDDPWNRAHYAPWFLKALQHYDQVFSPRRANLEDLRRAGCRKVTYLPFAYAPGVHFPDPPLTAEEHRRLAADVIFAGGADHDRLPWIRALIEAGFSMALYGGYWDRQSHTKRWDRGIAGTQEIRRAVAAGKVALCLVRQANRDGHAMRTFELAAMGACILAEDTPEQREILGEHGQGVVYFRSCPEMVERAQWLLEHDDERRRLAVYARERLSSGRNTYADRLVAMLEHV
ncbi:MAG: CgeB family protein [Terriglobales bacterium]